MKNININTKKIISAILLYVIFMFATACINEKTANAPLMFERYNNADDDMYLEIRTSTTDGEDNTYYIYDDSLIDEFVDNVRKIELQPNEHPKLITGKNDEDSSYYEKYKCYEINARIFYEESNKFCDRIYIYQSNVYLSDNDLIDYFQIDHNLSIYILEFVDKYTAEK